MKLLSTMILGAGLASSLSATELDQTVYSEASSIVVTVDEAAKTETVYAVENLDLLSEEASKEELDSLVESGDAKLIETIYEASDSEFDELSSTEAWGWFSSSFNANWGRYGRGYGDDRYRGGYNNGSRYGSGRYSKRSRNYNYRYNRYGHRGYQNGYYGYGNYRMNYQYDYRRGSRRFYCYY